jgi:transcriptional regulator with XRE-family HTH domain
MDKLIFAERLQLYLNAKGWKTADLVRVTEIKPNTLSDIFSGKTKEPRLDMLERLVRNTDIDPVFLLSGEGDAIKAPRTFAEGLPREARDACKKPFRWSKTLFQWFRRKSGSRIA